MRPPALLALVLALAGCTSGGGDAPRRAEVLPDRVVVANAQGTWTVRTRCATEDGRTVGPGYVSGLVAPDGTTVVDDLRAPGPLNDPEFGGLGAFAWHHARGEPGSLRFDADNAWEVSGRVCAAANGGFGVVASRLVEAPRGDGDAVVLAVEVDFSDGLTFPRPLLRARYAYRFEREVVQLRVEVEPLCPDGRCGRTDDVAFVKEPKVVAHATGGGFARMATFRADGTLACVFLGGGGERGAILDTGQCADPERDRLRLDFGSERSGVDGGCGVRRCLDVTVRDAELDAWALDAARLPAAFARDTPSIDGVVWPCHGGDPAAPLQRRWEVTGRKDAAGRYVSLGGLFPAWQGGRGGYDCEPLARPFPPAGRRYAVELELRLGADLAG